MNVIKTLGREAREFTQYRLSRRNQIRRALRPLGYEAYLFRKQRLEMSKLLESARERSTRLSLASAQEVTNSKNLIFTVTAGRSGSKFLADLFRIVPDTASRHEPHPCFTWFGEPCNADVAQEFWLRFKLPAIAAVGCTNYIETSHVAGKGFLEPLIQMGCTPTILAVGRPPRQVALSFLEKYTIPARTWLGRQWLLHPNAPQSNLTLSDWSSLSDYQLCYWYVLEMEAKQRKWLENGASLDVKVVDVDASAVHNFDYFISLLEWLGIVPENHQIEDLRRQHVEICNKKYNKVTRRNLEFFEDLARLEDEVWERVSVSDSSLRDWVTYRYDRQP